METTNTSNKQLCAITIMFPVDSDDEAIRIKKEIALIVAPIKESRVEFRLGVYRPGPVDHGV